LVAIRGKADVANIALLWVRNRGKGESPVLDDWYRPYATNPTLIRHAFYSNIVDSAQVTVTRR